MALGSNVVQGRTLINALYKQMTGKEAISALGTSDFISVANVVKTAPSNEIFDAIGKVISRTIFAVRPYKGKFDFMEKSDEQWGEITRKISPLYVDPSEDDTVFFKQTDPANYWTDGDSADMWKINKPKVAEFRFTGSVADSFHITRFTSQLQNAFNSPDELVRFWAMVTQEIENVIESKRDAKGRATMLNFMAGKIAGDSDNVIHCITAYNDETGSEITEETVFLDTNFVPFVKWLYAKMETISDFMTERTTKYHMNVTGKAIVRHTPKENQFALINTGMFNNIQTTVLSSVFNPEKLDYNFRKINYWQSIDTPMGINVATPSYLNTTNGEIKTHGSNVVEGRVLGMIYDEDAFGFNLKLNRISVSPENAANLTQNTFYHNIWRMSNDFTENAVVFVLD